MSLTKLQTVIIGFFLFISAIHLTAAAQQYQLIRTYPQSFLEPGQEFADLPALTIGNKLIGYFTDLDLSPENIDTGSFLSAQYQFAPARLDIDNKNTTFILIDASTPWAAYSLAEKLQAKPLYLNPQGKLLAQRP